MLNFIRDFFTKNIRLKITALILALALWFYIVNELNRGNYEERQFLNRMFPRNVAVPVEKTTP